MTGLLSGITGGNTGSGVIFGRLGCSGSVVSLGSVGTVWMVGAKLGWVSSLDVLSSLQAHKVKLMASSSRQIRSLDIEILLSNRISMPMIPQSPRFRKKKIAITFLLDGTMPSFQFSIPEPD